MITLKKLKWSNCFSYGPDNELDLADNTVTQIIGTNGMGKSSIPLIIEEVLYNKNSKGIYDFQPMGSTAWLNCKIKWSASYIMSWNLAILEGTDNLVQLD